MEEEEALLLVAGEKPEDEKIIKGDQDIFRAPPPPPRRGYLPVVEELKKVCYIAMPMVAVTVSQNLLTVASTSMVGHLGQLQLSGTAIATSLTNITGFSLLSGLVAGLETLCGQAYGAGQHKKVGVYTYSAIICLLLLCLPICVLWIFLDKFLILLGQDPSISLEAQKYSVWLIPALFGNAILKPLVRFLQSQSIILPLLVTSLLVLCLHVPLSWALIFKLDLGIIGAAVAFSLSNLFYLVLIVSYIAFSPSCKDSRVPLSKDAFIRIKEFLRYAIPSALMICLKWWSVEIVVLLSGLLPNPKLETSALSICLAVSTLHFTIPYGFGVAASTRVSNELGAGNPEAAQVVVWVVMCLAILETIITSTTLFCCRFILGYAFSDEKPLVDYISLMTPFICLSIVTDSIQATISGIARGSGWQHTGAYVNLGAFYLFGIPSAFLLGFTLHLKAKGLWMGIVIGSIIQSTILSLITGLTNWQKQANKARERISGASATTSESSAQDA